MKVSFSSSHERKDAKQSGESTGGRLCHGFESGSSSRGCSRANTCLKAPCQPKKLGEKLAGDDWEALTSRMGLGLGLPP